MSEYFRHKPESLMRPMIATATALGVIGLTSLMCEPEIIPRRLHGPIKPLVEKLITTCGESKDVRAIFERVPDEAVDEVVDSLQGYSTTREFSKAITKPGSKPHIPVLKVINQIASSLVNRGIIK